MALPATPFVCLIKQATSSNSVSKSISIRLRYGRIGRVVCEVLDRKLIRYIVFEVISIFTTTSSPCPPASTSRQQLTHPPALTPTQVDPQKAIEARNRDLPVFFGESRPWSNTKRDCITLTLILPYARGRLTTRGAPKLQRRVGQNGRDSYILRSWELSFTPRKVIHLSCNRRHF